MCNSTIFQTRCKECGGQDLVGAEVELGLDLGPVEDHLAICPHGRDPGGCLVSEED